VITLEDVRDGFGTFILVYLITSRDRNAMIAGVFSHGHINHSLPQEHGVLKTNNQMFLYVSDLSPLANPTRTMDRLGQLSSEKGFLKWIWRP
jgi:hypothetical protein